MENLVESKVSIQEEFHRWLFEACEFKSKHPHEVYPMVDLTDAKLCFLDGISAKEYSETI